MYGLKPVPFDGGPRLLAIAFAGGDPLAPFVVGDEGADYEGEKEDGEEDLHGFFEGMPAGKTDSILNGGSKIAP